MVLPEGVVLPVPGYVGVVRPDRTGVDVFGVMVDRGVPVEGREIGVVERGTKVGVGCGVLEREYGEGVCDDRGEP